MYHRLLCWAKQLCIGSHDAARSPVETSSSCVVTVAGDKEAASSSAGQALFEAISAVQLAASDAQSGVTGSSQAVSGLLTMVQNTLSLAADAAGLPGEPSIDPILNRSPKSDPDPNPTFACADHVQWNDLTVDD